MGQWIDLTSGDGFVLPAWLARTDGAPRGAVVVLQEIFGVNGHIRAVADWYAAHGYLALAPATFARVQAGVDLGYGPDDMQAGRALKAAAEVLPAPGLLADIQAAIDYARRHNGKVAVVGYCWGGLLAWRAACLADGLAAAVPYYGGGITGAQEMARRPRVPVLAHFGARDPWIPQDQVQAFAQAHPEVQVEIYAADHGFNCDQRASFDAAAARRARARTLAFLAQHVG